MREHFWTALGVLLTIAMIVLSAAINYSFGYSLGTTETNARIFGAVSVVAVGVMAVLPLRITAQWNQRRKGRAILGAGLFGILVAYAIASSIGFGMQNRSQLAGSRENLNAQLEDAIQDRDLALKRLQGLEHHAPADAVRGKIDAAKKDLDLGTGTGAVAILAATQVGTGGRIKAVDISPEMLARAGERVRELGLTNIDLVEGRAEGIPAKDGSIDAVLASLSLMYVIDRAAAAMEIARVLRPGGRLVAAVWGGAEEADIVKFQQTAGGFAPMPPVKGVGPGALADPSEFLSQLRAAGLNANCEKVTTNFVFASFQDAWDALAGVTAAALEPKVPRKKRRRLCAP